MESDVPARGEGGLPHADSLVDGWVEAWRRTGGIVLLLDFDGTLAPIVDRPELAELPRSARTALERLVAARGLHAAIISGRGLSDARERVRIDGVWYAGNHGMEISGPGIDRIHPEAAAARPALDAARRAIEAKIAGIDGAFVEDKRLTLSVHYRLAPRDRVATVRQAVVDAVSGEPTLRMTEGKEVLEVRPRVDWHKGRAVEFLLAQLDPAPGVPVIYLGDDTTDEDAFAVLSTGGRGDGVVVADPVPPGTRASAHLRDPAEVASLLERLARATDG